MVNNKKVMVNSTDVVYLNLFDLNKEWFDLKSTRQNVYDSVRKQRMIMYNLSLKFIEKTINQGGKGEYHI